MGEPLFMRTFGLDTAVMVCLHQIGVTPASVLVVGSTRSTQVSKVLYSSDIPYSWKFSLVQNFALMHPDPPEEIISIFIFAERKPFKPHPYQRVAIPYVQA